MKLNLELCLYANGNRMMVGGKNFPIASKKNVPYEFTVERFRGYVLTGAVIFSGIHFTLKQADQNRVDTYVCVGHLPDDKTKEKLDELAEDGWVIDSKMLKQYGIDM
jgi:hypothetical protein